MKIQNHPACNNTRRPPAILRAIKLRSWSAVVTSGGHTWRTIPVKHADPARQHLNQDWRKVTSPEALRTAIERRLALVTATKAKNPVLCIEYLVSARHEAFTEHGGETDANAYFRDAMAFLEGRHGADNLVAVNVQHDEAAPHLVVYVVPLVERPARTVQKSVFAGGHDEHGKLRRTTKTIQKPAETALSADHYNGTAEKLTKLQTDFAEQVAARHGLARGLELSASSHTTNKQHHRALAKAFSEHIGLAPEEIERKGRLWAKEGPEEQAGRLSELIREHYAPIVARAATAGHDRRRANELEETARRHEEHYQAAVQALKPFNDGLSDSQQAELKATAARWRQKNRERERQAAEHERQKRQAAERAAKLAALDGMQRLERREKLLMERLENIAPLEFARADEAIRLECWELLVNREELKGAFRRIELSGYIDHNSHLTEEGRRAVAEYHAIEQIERFPDIVTNPCPSDPDTMPLNHGPDM